MEPLGHESAAAVITQVRAIYGFPLPPVQSLRWANWFGLAVAARNHLTADVSEEASQKFMVSAMEQTDSDEVVKIMRTLILHDQSAHAKAVEELRKHHELKLLRSKNYRDDTLLYDVDVLWQHVDHLLDMVPENCINA